MANLFGPMPFTEVATISNDPHDPVPSYTTGAWLRELSDPVIDTLVQYGVSRNGSSPLVSTEVRHVGGAMADVDKSANAFPHRDQSLLLSLIGMTPTPEAHAFVVNYAGNIKHTLHPYISGLYANFVEGSEARTEIASAYPPETLQRLIGLKTKYDPDRLFDFSYRFAAQSDPA